MLKVANNGDANAAFLAMSLPGEPTVDGSQNRVSGCALQVGRTVEKVQPVAPHLSRGPLPAGRKPPSAGFSEAAGLPESLVALHCPRQEGKVGLYLEKKLRWCLQ